MSDFMKWLYSNYIKPHLDTIPKGDYSPDFYLLEDDVSPETCGSFGKTQEFTATHAFLLGLRTGQGLSDSLRTVGRTDITPTKGIPRL